MLPALFAAGCVMKFDAEAECEAEELVGMLLMLCSFHACTRSHVLQVQVNTVAPMESVGAVVGTATGFASLARALGPLLGGLGWGLLASLSFHGHQYVLFIIVGMVALLLQFVFSIIDLPDLHRD